MATIPPELRYSAEHEWITPLTATQSKIGVSEVATEALGEIVFVELPRIGSIVTAGAACGEIESTKSVSDLYSPVTGTVTEVNEQVSDDPSILNEDPYGSGWLFIVEVSSEGPLLTSTEYAEANGVA